MRIAIFSWESLHSILVGGISFHVSELAAALVRKGHEVHLFTRPGKAEQPWYECVDGVHYHRCPFDQQPDFLDNISAMCRSMVESFHQTEDHVGRFDIIHAHDWLTVPAMQWIRQGRGHPAVFTLHSTEYGRCGNIIYNGQSQRIRALEAEGITGACRAIAVSHTLRTEAQWLYSIPDGRIDVVYNGISFHAYDGWIDPADVKARYGIGAMDPTVLFVGRMTAQKGPDLLVESVPYILATHPNAKFVMAGEGDMRAAVEQRARDLRVAHAIRFHGYLPRAEVIDLYRACDCACVPSRNEPFGIVVLEAWSAGKPVVTTRTCGSGEIVWHDATGLHVTPSAESIAWGIGTLFADFERARWMGRNGRIAVETVFSWDSIAEQVLSVYGS